MVATAVAAFPTWEEWRFRLQTGGDEFRACIGWGPWETSPLNPLRGDLDAIMQNVEAWAVPALLVLVGFLACLGRRDARSVGRLTAGLLILIAVIEPATPAYASPDGCGGLIPILSAEWFTTVMSSWGSTQLCLLGAATLVLLATRMTSAATSSERSAVATSTGVTWRRLVALLVDYTIVVVTLPFAIPPILFLTGIDSSPSIHPTWGLLNSLGLSLVSVDPDRLIALSAIFLYFWGQHSLWGQTPGKRLLRIRLVYAREPVRPMAGRMALRTLLFPLLVFTPVAGPLALIVDVLWALLDPDGRTLHDRLANTEVTRRVPNVQPQT
ncbi:RDD family protein [Sphaerisporangium sp. NPDC088356]|uniref:RDD family protein n=1 Tax=Sphaerisporangium sp. NPDC088356 TaxID=3154871 RepID=UPI003436A5B6